MGDFPVSSFRLGETGLLRVLGELEKQIMEAIWGSGAVAIRDVWAALSRERDISFNAVMTVMNRLVEKGLLAREGQKGGYVYSAVYDRSEFLGHVSERVAQGLVEDFGEFAVPQFLKALETASPDLLAKLREALGEEGARSLDGADDSGE